MNVQILVSQIFFYEGKAVTLFCAYTKNQGFLFFMLLRKKVWDWLFPNSHIRYLNCKCLNSSSKFSYRLWRIVNSSKAQFILSWCVWQKLVINHDLEIPTSLYWLNHKWIMDDWITHSCLHQSYLESGDESLPSFLKRSMPKTNFFSRGS